VLYFGREEWVYLEPKMHRPTPESVTLKPPSHETESWTVVIRFVVDALTLSSRTEAGLETFLQAPQMKHVSWENGSDRKYANYPPGKTGYVFRLDGK
jgi:hypothetical protein